MVLSTIISRQNTNTGVAIEWVILTDQVMFVWRAKASRRRRPSGRFAGSYIPLFHNVRLARSRDWQALIPQPKWFSPQRLEVVRMMCQGISTCRI
jgi:hypothetical protein